MKKTRKEEFILYNNYDFENNKIIANQNMEQENIEKLYNEIDKRQKRNAKILCISIFLYFLSFAWLISTLEYFEKNENDDMWFLTSLIIFIVATILLIFSKVTKSKIGKIKYQYKNTKYFYISCIFGTLGLFMLSGGITNMNLNIIIFIAILLLGLAVSFDIYHDITKGKKQGHLSSLQEILIIFFLAIISIALGSYLYYKNDKPFDSLEFYFKSASTIYDENNRANLIVKTDNVWYTFLNKYNTNHYEFSVSSKPEENIIFYETKGVDIYNLYGNNNYAVWSEISDNEVKHVFYDKNENSIYELITLPYNDEFIQNFNIGLYNDKIYYEYIDYENNKVLIEEYNITTSEEKTIYTIDNIETSDLARQTLNVNENNLLLTTYIDGLPTLLHFNLDKLNDENYKEKSLLINYPCDYIYSVSYENDIYAIYFNEIANKKIGIFDKNGNLKTEVTKYNLNNFIANYYIYLKDNKLYWINYNIKDKDLTDNYKLIIYNLETKQTHSVDNIFNFTFDNKKLYGLGYYKGNQQNVRLYEIFQ